MYATLKCSSLAPLDGVWWIMTARQCMCVCALTARKYRIAMFVNIINESMEN